MLMRTLAIALMLLTLAMPARVQGKMPTLNAFEMGQLPQYCLGGNHGDRQKYGALPQYNIPKVCGNGMNHLCNGHVYLIAAQRINLSPRDRRFFAQKAGGEFEYTKRHMTAECPLRREVEESLVHAQMIRARLASK
jgi:hypothetical protein